MRGIAILLVLLGHSIGTTSHLANMWILSFHMPLFFFISGLVANVETVDFRASIKKLCFTLVIPIVTAGVIDLLADILFEVVLTKEKTIFEIGFFSHFRSWFLWAILFVKFFHYIKGLVKWKNKYGAIITAEILLVIICYEFKDLMPVVILQVLVASVFFDMGICLRGMTERLYEQREKMTYGLVGLGALVLVCTLSVCNDPIRMYENGYGNLMLFFVTAASGILLVLKVSQMLCKTYLLSICSQKSIIIYIIHMPILRVIRKLFTIAGFQFDSYPIFLIIFLVLLVIVLPCAVLLERYLPFLFGKKIVKRRVH